MLSIRFFVTVLFYFAVLKVFTQADTVVFFYNYFIFAIKYLQMNFLLAF